MTMTIWSPAFLLLALRASAVFAVDTGLSPHLQLISYDLTVKIPDPTVSEGFTASVVMHFILTATSSNITLHAKNLHNTSRVSMISANDSFEPILISTRFHTETVEFTFLRPLPKGQYLLTIGEYSGQFTDGSTGVIQRNQKLFTTHLQPNFARQLLPCIDHPSVKAVFRVTVIHRVGTQAQSNTIATDVSVVNTTWQKTVFAPAPPLPAYLVTFSVMPPSYQELERQTSFGVTVRVHATTLATARRVLDTAVASFELLANIMEIPLPLNKVDFVMVPHYDGGMENWGHVLLSENLATSGDDAHLTYIIAHELAHHWIGDKATVDSWRWICLQEDLTDYIAYKVAAAVMGHDQRWERFLLSKYVAIQLTEDFFAPEHSLVLPENVTQNMISSHCYLKGVVLLESLESVVGEEYMLAVIRNLVATKATFDLKTFLFYFEDIPVDRNISLAQVYEFWFTNGGFPSLKVSSASLCFELHQLERFPWPLRITSTQSLPPFLFAQTLTLPPKSPNTLVNVNFTSFMRVNYDSTTWVNIFSQLDEHPEQFSAVGRAQLVTDFCYFYAHDEVDSGAALKELVVDTVYRNPEHFELCDWHLFWCHSTAPATLPQLLRRVALGVTRLFNTDDAFGCRTGMAARNLNAICNSVFSTKCV